MFRFRPIALTACLLLGAGSWPMRAQQGEQDETLDPEKFEKQSVALRTALHYDPTLEAPLTRLVELYRSANRADELLAIYQSHVAQYPTSDPGARAVMLRLMMAMNKPGVAAAVRSSVEDYPDSAFIHFLSWRDLSKTRDPRAIDALSKAIELETRVSRKQQWIDQLVERAVVEDRRDLAEKHLVDLAALPSQTAESLLGLARKMYKAKFHELALKTLATARTRTTSPELGVDMELLAASAESALKKYAEAGQRLDTLLKKVAPDYWRRSEIVSRRVNLLRTDAAREEMLRAARAAHAANPDSEATILDLAELLVACELRRDALKVLLDASERTGGSNRIEDAVVKLFDRLNDEHGIRAYLERRLEENPERADLAYRYVKALYVTGGAKEARERFDALLENLDEEARLKQMLELARYLRRMTQPGDAAALFERIVKEQPERLDVRRELAESYIAVNKRQAARALFTAELAEDAEVENFLDIVQFMIAEEILVEAKKALNRRLASDESNFELRVLLIDVHGKLGEQLAGEQLLESTRLLADTDARYKRWLEAGADFHELFDTVEGFFDAEQGILLAGEEGETWTPERLSRFVAFCDIAGRNHGQERVAGILRGRIADENLPSDLRSQLRRMLVELLERDPNATNELKTHLEALVLEDSEREDEYRLRMGKMFHGANLTGDARRYLEAVEFAKVGNASLLGGVHSIYLEYNLPEMAMAALERATELDPTSRSNWKNWLSALAAAGEEARLRTALRKLLAGIDRMPLADDTYDVLRAYLVDSYWRTIARILDREDPADMGEIFAHLDAIERSKKLDDDGLWVLWTRAWVLNAQGRGSARDEAVAGLRDFAAQLAERREEIAEKNAETETTETTETTESIPGGVASSEVEQPANPPAEAPVRIHFPDGLSVSLKAALAFLEEPPAASRAVVSSATKGPLAPLEVRWAFETDHGDAIHDVVSLGEKENAVLLRTYDGGLYKIDLASGKLLWKKSLSRIIDGGGLALAVPGGFASRSQYVRHYSQGYSNTFTSMHRRAPIAADGEGRFYVPYAGGFAAVRTDNGEVSWRADLDWKPSVLPQLRAPTSVFIDGPHVVAYDASRGIAAGCERATGKLAWAQTVLPEDAGSLQSRLRILSDFSTGASCADGFLFVYGLHAGILDTATGDVIWSFEQGNVRRFPIELPSPDSDPSYSPYGPLSYGGTASSKYAPFARSPYGSTRLAGPSAINHMASQQQRAAFARQFVSQSGYLAAPAVTWANNLFSGYNAAGYVSGRRLLLLGNGTLAAHSLTLPLGAAGQNFQGTFVGFAGSKACFLQGSLAAMWNMRRNTLETVSTAEATGADTAGAAGANAVLDGSRLYVTGEKGVLCVNVHTGRKIFFSPWPETVAQYFGTTENSEGENAARGSAEYYWQGIVPSAAKASQANSQFSSSRLGFSSSYPYRRTYPYSSSRAGQVMRRALPVRGEVAGGKLLAIAPGGQILALGDSSGEGDRAN